MLTDEAFDAGPRVHDYVWPCDKRYHIITCNQYTELTDGKNFRGLRRILNEEKVTPTLTGLA